MNGSISCLLASHLSKPGKTPEYRSVGQFSGVDMYAAG